MNVGRAHLQFWSKAQPTVAKALTQTAWHTSEESLRKRPCALAAWSRRMNETISGVGFSPASSLAWMTGLLWTCPSTFHRRPVPTRSRTSSKFEP